MEDGDVYTVFEVFTPTRPARSTFVERTSINDKLVGALRTPGKQIVVYGHTGSGKTTLLVNKLHQLFEDHIITRCFPGMLFDHILLDAFDQLNKFYDVEKVQARKSQHSSSIQVDYSIIKAQIGGQTALEDQNKQQRILPPQLTPQTLARFLGEANCCWVLEDFHKIASEEKAKLSGIMKIFVDMSDQYNDLKIITIGAVDTAREVIEYNMEMRNRVSEIHVPLMTDLEIKEIIDKGEQILNFSIMRRTKRGIVRYSNGLASVCHQLCLNICDAAGIRSKLSKRITITDNELDNALELYLQDASDTLKSAFNKAFRQIRETKFDNKRIILQALSEYDQEGATRADILAAIKTRVSKYPARNLTVHLEQLRLDEWGSLIRFDSSSGKYSFSDPIYRAYAMTSFMRNNQKVKRDNDTVLQQEIHNLLHQTLIDVIKNTSSASNKD